ncbi:MAG: hypothetical protein IJ806_07625 [Ruminococcus sp.]|nr:hypothetical protein [Ruminococcus sp.]
MGYGIITGKRLGAEVLFYGAVESMMGNTQKKILIVGDGAAGSCLAHFMIKAGHSVTFLTQGKRRNILMKNGLIIRHRLQHKRTVDKPQTVGKADGGERFDAVFAAQTFDRRREDLELISGIDAPIAVLTGSDPEPEKTLKSLTDLCKENGKSKQVLFADAAAVGKNEGRAVSLVRAGRCRVYIGQLSGRVPKEVRRMAEDVLGGTGLSIKWQDRMEDYLLCKACTMLPLAYVYFACGGDLKKSTAMQRRQMISAMGEAFDTVKAMGRRVLPKKRDRWTRPGPLYTMACLVMFVLAKSSLGELTVGAYCKSSLKEIELTDRRFMELAAGTGRPMPNFEMLKKQTPAYAKLYSLAEGQEE